MRAGRDDSVHSIHPLELVTPRRLDLICKSLYLRQLRSSTDSTEPGPSQAAQLYEKHITLRTGGLEPPDPFHCQPDAVEKRSVADYVREARHLLASLSTNGFDPGAPVAYFADGTLGNGAHRISAALALDIPIVAKLHEGHGTAWNFNWFVQNGFTTEELQQLLYWYVRLKADDVAVFVCYAPAKKHWDSLAQTIAEAFYLVGQMDISVESELGMYELVHDLYATLEPRSPTHVIHRKALLLAMAKPLTVRVIVGQRKNAGDNIYRIATDTKTRCREIARETVAPESYLAVHAASSKPETLNLAGVLLSPNNLRQLSRRRSAGARAEFLRWLAECRDTCVDSAIAVEDICVVGSSPLEVVGVRASTDIDFTLKDHYRKARYGSGVTHLTPVVDIVTAGYHRSHQRAAIGDDELVDNPDHHFMFRGMKFANPEIVLDQKDFYRRNKDVRDVEAARVVFAAPLTTPFDPVLDFASCTEVLLRELTNEGSAQGQTKPRRALSRLGNRLYDACARVAIRARRRYSAYVRRSHGG